MKTMGAFISKVYQIIDSFPAQTAGEIFQIYSAEFPRTTRSRGDIAKRLSDLMQMGLARKTGTKVCDYSGCSASVWETLPLGKYEICDNMDELNEGSVSELHFNLDEECDDVGASSCCGCCGCQEEENTPEDIKTMSREEKAQRLSEIAGETCRAMDHEDMAFLNMCYHEMERMESNALARLLMFCVPGMKRKAESFKKALRYFE
jgi:hypothetical protein